MPVILCRVFWVEVTIVWSAKEGLMKMTNSITDARAKSVPLVISRVVPILSTKQKEDDPTEVTDQNDMPAHLVLTST